MTEAEIKLALAGSDEWSQLEFKAPSYLELLAGKDEHEGYGHYTRYEIYRDTRNGLYVGVEGGGCSCDGADAAWTEETLQAALANFSSYQRDEIETELKTKGLL